jgi:feruloyl-CoA synthase
VFDAIKALAVESCGERILFLTGLGATETGPFALGRLWEAENATNVGLPPPGLEVKLVPVSGRYEARLRGPNVTPGYWREPQLTAAAFDEEGFYRLGDAFVFEEPADARRGLLFVGRLAEDFKLASGTWVAVGPLRARVAEHFAPYARDVVIVGADRDELGALLFPDLAACRALLPGCDAAMAPGALLADARVRAVFHERLETLAATATGSSNRICRLMLLEEPPSLDAGEITDKGSLNQRAVLERRAALVAELYAEPPSARVIALPRRQAA